MPLYNQLFVCGPVAQLGARLDGIQEVTGSIPVRSTILRLTLAALAANGWRATLISLRPKHDRRIHSHGPACRNPRRRNGDEAQSRDRRRLRQRVPRFYLEEQASH